MAKQGTPQATIEAFTAPDFKSNATYVDALKLQNFYNSFELNSLAVKGIVAIQANASSNGAEVLTFNELRALGVGEDVRLYLAFDRRKGNDDPQIGVNLEIVGLAVNIVAKAANEFQAFANLVQSVDPSIPNSELPALLLQQTAVKEAAQKFLSDNLPKF